MAVKQYIGARYVPEFASPLDWDNSKTYEPLTIVYYKGNSYTSRQSVPAGIDINNENYWALTGNYNAQIEQYRAEVRQVSSNLQTLETTVSSNTNNIAKNRESIAAETSQRTQQFNQLSSQIDSKADIPNRVNKFSNTPENNTIIQSVDEKIEVKVAPYTGLNIGAFPQQLMNPLPLLWIANGYRIATNIKYGNDYTATNLNSNYDGWEPARNHPDTDGKLHIDCTTFVILAMCGIRYNGSTYSTSGTNVGNSYPINFFSDTVKNYMNYEYQLLGEDPANEPEHRRLLASELAKLLDDSGMMNHLRDGMTIAEKKAALHPGDIVFFENTSTDIHYRGIGHCAIIAYNDTSNLIAIDCSKNRGGTNNCVNYHVVSNTEINQINTRVACPQYATIFTDQQMIGPFSGPLTADKTAQQSFPLGGVACVKATETGSTTFTFDITFPDPVGKITYRETLTQNQVQQIIMPPGTSISITASVHAKYTHWVSNNYMGTFVID